MSLVLAGIVPPFTLNLWQDVQVMWQYDFMRQALAAGTVLSLVARLVGSFVVVRHQAFAGESLSDVAFTGALGGAALGLNPLATPLIATIGMAIACEAGMWPSERCWPGCRDWESSFSVCLPRRPVGLGPASPE